MKTIYVASDHAGFDYKEKIKVLSKAVMETTSAWGKTE